MVDKSLLSKIQFFLLKFKECAAEGNVDYSEVKAKTTTFLRSIGWTNRAMNEYILENIEAKHYFRGPTEHHYEFERTIVEFGMILEDTKLYVKLELIVDQELLVAGYMSFHPREQAIDYFPLDETGEVK